MAAVGCIEDTAAELGVEASDAVDFAVVAVMAEAECISGWVYAHSRLLGSLEPAYNPAGPDAVEAELWSIAEAEEFQRRFLVAAVVTVELARVVEVAREGHHCDLELM
jgi:hypothetical protein